MQPIALIFGITGQDGALLAKFLLGKGYEVWGTTRTAQLVDKKNLEYLQVLASIRLIEADPENSESVLAACKTSRATEVYNLAGQSSVGLSFDLPMETFRGIALGALNVLNAARQLDLPPKIFNAGSGECFGDTGQNPANETTPFFPGSPYAVAKASAFWLTKNYRETYGLFASTGILFNHESPLRPERFVTQKIIRAAWRISQGSTEKLQLGRLDIWRDWGWAPDYVEAMWLSLQTKTAEDYVIASGKTHSLREFVATAFATFNLDWHAHVSETPALYRPSDIVYSYADPSKAAQLLGWKAKNSMHDAIEMMAQALVNRA